jgi:hypothetical protein
MHVCIIHAYCLLHEISGTISVYVCMRVCIYNTCILSNASCLSRTVSVSMSVCPIHTCLPAAWSPQSVCLSSYTHEHLTPHFHSLPHTCVCMYVCMCAREYACMHEFRTHFVYDRVRNSDINTDTHTHTCTHAHVWHIQRSDVLTLCIKRSKLQTLIHTYCDFQNNWQWLNRFQQFLVLVYLWKIVENRATTAEVVCKSKHVHACITCVKHIKVRHSHFVYDRVKSSDSCRMMSPTLGLRSSMIRFRNLRMTYACVCKCMCSHPGESFAVLGIYMYV